MRVRTILRMTPVALGAAALCASISIGPVRADERQAFSTGAPTAPATMERRTSTTANSGYGIPTQPVYSQKRHISTYGATRAADGFLLSQQALDRNADVVSVRALTQTGPESEIAIWRAEAGDDLKSTLEAWARAVGWNVAWDSEFTYPLIASGQWEGTFTYASSALLETFQYATPAIVGEFYTQNRVLVVKTPSAFRQ